MAIFLLGLMPDLEISPDEISATFARARKTMKKEGLK